MKKTSLFALAALLTGCICWNEHGVFGFVEPFGATKTGEKASLYTLRGDGALVLKVTDFGGRLVSCLAPDRDGNLADVTLGWNTVGEYETLGFSMGTLIGRYGNRIADGRFTLDGREWRLPVNETTPAPRHCTLHGGTVGWDAKVWKVEKYDGRSIVLSLVSPDGDMGFPGTVKMKVTYTVGPGDVWRIDYEATTDKPTVLNPTHHSYWNLAGEASGNVLAQTLKINADKYTQTTAGLIPTKDAPVDGTGFDFRAARPIGSMAAWMAAQKELAAMDNWYDHNFVLKGAAGALKPAAEMYDPASGRVLEIFTTEPCMQMYGAQNMTDALNAKAAGKHLCQFAGVALETQHHPDAPNHPEFPSTVLRPGEVFRSTTEYRFGTR
ncbi:MAG: galactose mutarotase [Kiritimatiellae bacterium]|nr:galactose mutarotase [Kiritimatiellia bacterium]